MHPGSQPAVWRAAESEPEFGPYNPVELDAGHHLHHALLEKRILAVAPQVRDCLVVSVHLRGCRAKSEWTQAQSC